MPEQILELVKQYGKETVVDNPAIPNEEKSAVLAEATNTITAGMHNMLAAEDSRISFLFFPVVTGTITSGINKAEVLAHR